MRRLFITRCIVKGPLAALAVIVSCSIFTSFATAQQLAAVTDVPRTLSYQGVVRTDKGPLPDGEYTITARLYSDADGRTIVWEGVYTTRIEGGVFNLALGRGDHPLPASDIMSAPFGFIARSAVDGCANRRIAQKDLIGTASAHATNSNSLCAECGQWHNHQRQDGDRIY